MTKNIMSQLIRNIYLIFFKVMQKIEPQHSMYESKTLGIDETWVNHIDKSIISLLTCPICYQIILQPIECSNCGRLFCKKDYYACKSKQPGCCPLCKQYPFLKKSGIHIANKSLFNLLKFQCKNCPESQHEQYQKYSLDELTHHLYQIHNKKIQKSPENLEQFYLEVQPIHGIYPNIIELSCYQNLQILYQTKIKKNELNIKLLHKDLNVIFIDLKMLNFSTDRGIYGKINTNLSKTLLAKKEYNVWVFKNQGNDEQFYLQQHQKQLDDEYQKYVSGGCHKKDEQIIIKSVDGKIIYRINFAQMLQINFYTKYARPIKNMKILFKSD